MYIVKRDGKKELFNAVKIRAALAAAFSSVGSRVKDRELDAVTTAVIEKITSYPTTVEQVQDLVQIGTRGLKLPAQTPVRRKFVPGGIDSFLNPHGKEIRDFSVFIHSAHIESKSSC